jgi:hypothetical protein
MVQTAMHPSSRDPKALAARHGYRVGQGSKYPLRFKGPYKCLTLS